jgi:hypothetical protein
MPMNIHELSAMNILPRIACQEFLVMNFCNESCAHRTCDRAFQFVISPFRTATALPLTNHCKDDGGFNEDDVMVAVSRVVVVVHAHPNPFASWRGEAKTPRSRSRRFHEGRGYGGPARQR